MLTTDQINAMSDEEARATLDRLATAHFHTPRWQTAFTAAVGYRREAAHQWMTKRPPVWTILLLDSWVRNASLKAAMQNLMASITPSIGG